MLRFLLVTALVAALAFEVRGATLEFVEAGEPQVEEEIVDPSIPATAYQDIELWLGEKTGRFGDYEFACSGGSPQYPTPTGAFVIEWKSPNHFSKQWQAPMPYAQFFHNGAAIHKGDVSGQSHGCVRVPEHVARYLFSRTREQVTRVFVYP